MNPQSFNSVMKNRNIHFNLLKLNRIIEWLKLEETLKINKLQLPAMGKVANHYFRLTKLAMLPIATLL